ncbi:hypothetical protein CDAR_485391 [Caerostris darwini]|uniref:Uncharacterized protein n=1 Tax=Caerostris darwini TaxID=1538125 RepID=A0AAV4PDZ1_9ARAC|nr:hypothetical protein CDAR_485391 [Caerostris darwini]
MEGRRREGKGRETERRKRLREKSVPALNEIAAVPSGLRSAKTSSQLIRDHRIIPSEAMPGENALFNGALLTAEQGWGVDEMKGREVKRTERTKRFTETIKRGPCVKNPSLLLMKLLQCHLGCALRKQALN